MNAAIPVRSRRPGRRAEPRSRCGRGRRGRRRWPSPRTPPAAGPELARAAGRCRQPMRRAGPAAGPAGPPRLARPRAASPGRRRCRQRGGPRSRSSRPVCGECVRRAGEHRQQLGIPVRMIARWARVSSTAMTRTMVSRPPSAWARASTDRPEESRNVTAARSISSTGGRRVRAAVTASVSCSAVSRSNAPAATSTSTAKGSSSPGKVAGRPRFGPGRRRCRSPARAHSVDHKLSPFSARVTYTQQPQQTLSHLPDLEPSQTMTSAACRAGRDRQRRAHGQPSSLGAEGQVFQPSRAGNPECWD